jgi:hypothetical protein
MIVQSISIAFLDLNEKDGKMSGKQKAKSGRLEERKNRNKQYFLIFIKYLRSKITEFFL